MAPCRISIVLALEIETTWWEAESPAGDPQVDPGHEPGQPAVGAPRIYGELLKLGIAVGQTSVAKYMARRRGGPSQGWWTFLSNHADGIASMDLFVVPTLSFRLLYGFVILRHCRRRIVWLGVTENPTAEWITQQLTEACG